MSDFLPILLGTASKLTNRNDNVNPDNFPTDVVRNYNVRNTNIPDSNISIQNFQDATLGKKISKKFDRDFRTLLSSPQAIKRWRVPQESDLLGNDLQKFPSFAHFLAFGKEHNQIELTVNQNAKELFEIKKDTAAPDPDPGAITIMKAPELHIETIDQTSTHQLNFETIFNEQGQYRLWHGLSWNTMQTEMATGKSEVRLQFSPDTRQYSHLKLSIQDLNAKRHPNLWCSYDHEEILQQFKTIKIEGLFGNNTRDALFFDVNEPDDVDTIYRNYLARENGFTYSDANPIDYKNSVMIKYMKQRTKFLTSNNNIVIDISKSKGYTGRDDPPNNVINPDVTLKFKTATAKNYIFTVTAFFDSSHILTTNGAAVATDKIIEYCPTLEPIKNGL